ncbi:hypothetical protein OC834_005835 [Tilletia horrida]|nr:hypothetical protein OC834_005835 [Tilletia horrida]
MSPPSPATPTKGRSTRWPTNLAVSGDFVLGVAKTDNCIHEVAASMYDSNHREYRATLSVWSRDVPWQGVYLLVCQAFATHPNRIAIGDVSELRLVPPEFDGLDRSKPSLPRAQTLFSGVAVLDSVDEDRRSGLAVGFTHLDKAQQWKRFTIRIEFEPTSRWNGWLLPHERSLISFDAVFAEFGYADTFKCWIRRINYIDAASPTLLRALGIAIPGSGDRADRLRQLYSSSPATATTQTAESSTSGSANADAASGPPGDTPVPAAASPTTSGAKGDAVTGTPPATPTPASGGKQKAVDDEPRDAAEDLDQAAARDIEAMLATTPPAKVRRTAASTSRSRP